MTDRPVSTDALDELNEKIQETLIEQARRLINNDRYTKAILSTLPIAMVATDRKGFVRSKNRAAEQLLSLDGLGEKTPFSACFDDNAELAEAFTRCLKNGEKAVLDSHEFLASSGEQLVVNIYLHPLHDDEAELCGVLLAVEDRTYISFLQDSVQSQYASLIGNRVVAQSKPMKKLMGEIPNHAQPGEPVLISGAHGSGKTFVAAKLHEAAGRDAKAPFVVIDCNTIADQNPLAYIFGEHSGEQRPSDEIHFRSVHDYGILHLADKGTLVLKHAEALPLDAQEALLHYLDNDATGFLEGISAQILLTTATSLEPLIEEGAFDASLFEKLKIHTLKIPTLWKRRKDILPLARLFLEESEHGAEKKFSQSAENILISRHYDYNNVSELKEAVQLAALVSGDDPILPEHIFTGPKEEDNAYEFEVSRLPFVRWVVRDEVLGILRYAVLSFFALIILSGFLLTDSVVGEFSNSLVWGVWWPGLVFVFFFFGRLWCSVCPLSQAAKLTKKLFKEGRPPPKWMKRHSWIFFPAGFVTILWAEHVFHMVDNPAATGVLLVALIALASIFAVVFKRETWCRYLCPLGSLGAVYSLPATLNVRSNPNVCATMCTTHDCNKGNETQSGCPVFHHPLYAREAHVCKLCFDCLKSCTHDSAKLYLRPPLIRLWKQGELGGALGLFALVVFAVSPLLLGSQSIEVLSDPLVFTTLLLGCVALAVTLRKMIKVMIVAGPAHIEAAVSRIVFILLLLGWGPLAAFQIANFPAADSLTISGSLGPVWGVLITESGISLLTVLQSLAILFSGALAVTALWGIKRRFSSDEIVIKGLGRQLLVGLAAGYLSLNLLLVLAA